MLTACLLGIAPADLARAQRGNAAGLHNGLRAVMVMVTRSPT